jgi:hypothetical protein
MMPIRGVRSEEWGVGSETVIGKLGSYRTRFTINIILTIDLLKHFILYGYY